jgi:hypothetical protein
MCVSRLRLATSCLSLRFSSSSCFRLCQLACAEIAVQLLPAVERLFRDPHLPSDLGHRRPCLRLFQGERNLLLGKPALLHGSAPPVRVPQNRKTRIQAGPKIREDVTRGRTFLVTLTTTDLLPKQSPAELGRAARLLNRAVASLGKTESLLNTVQWSWSGNHCQN